MVLLSSPLGNFYGGSYAKSFTLLPPSFPPPPSQHSYLLLFFLISLFFFFYLSVLRVIFSFFLSFISLSLSVSLVFHFIYSFLFSFSFFFSFLHHHFILSFSLSSLSCPLNPRDLLFNSFSLFSPFVHIASPPSFYHVFPLPLLLLLLLTQGKEENSGGRKH